MYLVFFSCEESLVYDRIGITKIAAKCILVVAVIQVKSVFYAFGKTFGLSKESRLYQRKVDVDMLNAVKNVLADVSLIQSVFQRFADTDKH